MPQLPTSRIRRSIYRQTFEIKDKGVTKYRHTLLINPEDMSVEEPHRASVQQTLGGAYSVLFGRGLQTVTISGKTGYNARKNAEGVLTDGYQELRNFRNLLYRDFITMPSYYYEMFWYNWEDEEYYQIIPLMMRIQRNTSLGGMYRYEMQFICVEEIGSKERGKAGWALKVANLINIILAGNKAATLAPSSSALSIALNNFLKGGAGN